MVYTSTTYRLGTVVSLKFLAIENMPRITLKLCSHFRQVRVNGIYSIKCFCSSLLTDFC